MPCTDPVTNCPKGEPSAQSRSIKDAERIKRCIRRQGQIRELLERAQTGGMRKAAEIFCFECLKASGHVWE